MTPNDETLYKGKAVNPTSKEQSKGTWKKVAIGGAAAILLAGAGTAAYAGVQYAKDHTGEEGGEDSANESKPQHEGAQATSGAAQVSEELSFADAFTAARAQVGPGGVFTWHGNLYGTYTEAEWNAMSAEQKADFAAAATGTDLHAHHVEAQHVAHVDPVQHEEDVTPVHRPNANIHPANNEEPTPHPTPEPSPQMEDPIPESEDVHIVARGEVEGHYAVGYSTTHNGEVEVAVVDINDNHKWDGEDVIVARNGQSVTLDEFARGEIDNGHEEDPGGYCGGEEEQQEFGTHDNEDDPNMHLAMNDNPEVAPGMPDYMDDAYVDGDFNVV